MDIFGGIVQGAWRGGRQFGWGLGGEGLDLGLLGAWGVVE